MARKRGRKIIEKNEEEIYLRPKAIAKMITNTTTTAAIIPIMINNFFKGKNKGRRTDNTTERDGTLVAAYR